MEKFIKDNDIFLAIQRDDKIIKIPYQLFTEEFKNRQGKKNKLKLDEYVENYLRCDKLIDNISKYIFNNLDESEGLNLKKDINILKEYKYIDLILEELNIDLDNLENRLIDVLVNLEVKEEEITDLKSNVSKEIVKESNTYISDEYIEEIIEKLENTEYIRASKSKEINKDCKPLLVIVYNNSYMDKPIENSIFDIHMTKQPLEGIIETKQINMRWVKIIEFDIEIDSYFMETIKADLCLRFRPTTFSAKDLVDNDKWVNAKLLKKHFNISDGVRADTLEKVYDCLGFGYVTLNDVVLFNKRLFKDAENIYVNEIGKKIKYK